MRFLSAILLIALFSMIRPSSAFEAAFSEAQNAYDTGEYEKAAELYTSLLDEGVTNPEVHYNLANASFKLDQLPTAVWHYRKAWYSLPRDPDIQANLHFALAAAGAVDPEPGMIESLCTLMPRNQWLAVAMGGYLLLTILLMLAILLPVWRRTLIRISLIPVVLLLLSGGGWWYWHRLELHPEWVVVKNDAKALYGPIKDSTAHYRLPFAALVRQQNMNAKGWIEIEYDGKRGWIPETYIKRISP